MSLCSIMTGIWFIFLLANLVYGLNPSCINCKYFIKNTLKSELGLCKRFSSNINNRKVYNLAIFCRSDEKMCGKSGSEYESNENIEKKLCEYKDLECMCSVEFTNEDDLKELEKIEKDVLDIFQRMRKHNTKRIYKTTKDLYKLFKK